MKSFLKHSFLVLSILFIVLSISEFFGNTAAYIAAAAFAFVYPDFTNDIDSSV